MVRYNLYTSVWFNIIQPLCCSKLIQWRKICPLLSRRAAIAMWQSSQVAQRSNAGWLESATSGATTWPLTPQMNGKTTSMRSATPTLTWSSRACATWGSPRAWQTLTSTSVQRAATRGKVGGASTSERAFTGFHRFRVSDSAGHACEWKSVV